jgi:Cys-tRNA synthase (O-phospho-L-seryl-tRNA:Cys-tRNA synthase)
VFTSAGSVYAENSGGEVDESSELAAGPRSSTLIQAERPVLAKVKDDADDRKSFFLYQKNPWE